MSEHEPDGPDGPDGQVDRDLQERMVHASDTLVVDTTLIRVNAVRAGRRRRRLRNGVVVGGAVASVVLVAAMSTQVAGGGGTGDDERPGERPGAPQYVDRPGRSEPPAEIGNVTLRRGTDGVFVAKGGLAPRATAESRVELWAARDGGPLTRRDEFAPRAGLGVFGHRFRLAPGTWEVELRYVHDGDGSVPSGTYATTLTLRGATGAGTP